MVPFICCDLAKWKLRQNLSSPFSFAQKVKYALWPWSNVPLELKARGLRQSQSYALLWHGQMKFEPITLFSQASFWKVTNLRQAALFPKQEESLPKTTKDQYYVKVLNIIAPAAVFRELPFELNIETKPWFVAASFLLLKLPKMHCGHGVMSPWNFKPGGWDSPIYLLSYGMARWNLNQSPRLAKQVFERSLFSGKLLFSLNRKNPSLKHQKINIK
jgi:hypothetical protein